MKKASPLVLIASLFLSVFFVGIMLFVLLEVLKVGDYHAFPQIITFAGINLAIFALVIGGGKFLANSMGTAPYASVCGVTVIYTLIQFTHLGFCFKTDATAGYTLFHLLLLFVYCAIVIPIGVMGINNKKD